MGHQVSIIIPCKEIDTLTIECITRSKGLDHENFEIIVLPDHESSSVHGIKIIPTGEVSPGRKRNIGIARSSGEFLAFIDNDAYPRRDWLKNAIRYFDDANISAVGGPGVTPSEDPLLQKAGGYVLSSFMMGGLANRFRSNKSIESDDIHSCNFIVRRSVLEETGGWNEKYWPGEDTLMCLAIKKTGKKMIEAADVVVYHHRRPLFMKHLKQVSRFGQHRGFFAKRYPDTSLRFNYFIPSLLVIFIIIGLIISIIGSPLKIFFGIISVLYLLAILVVSFKSASDGKDILLVPFVFSGTIVTHLVYGTYFLSGLSTSELER